MHPNHHVLLEDARSRVRADRRRARHEAEARNVRSARLLAEGTRPVATPHGARRFGGVSARLGRVVRHVVRRVVRTVRADVPRASERRRRPIGHE